LEKTVGAVCVFGVMDTMKWLGKGVKGQMKLLNKELCVALILSAMLAFIIAYLPATFAIEETDVPDQVIDFLRDVVTLDMTKYTVTPYKPAFRYREDLNGLPELGGKVSLQGYRSRIDFTYSLINNTLNSMDLYVLEGSPLFSQTLPVDIGGAAKGFLQRY
jgi:hypothetical protein